MKMSKKQRELISLYDQMVREGITRSDGSHTHRVYSDFQLSKFKEWAKAFFERHRVKSVLDYGAGGSDWDTMPVFDGKTARQYFGLDVIKYYEPARSIDERGSVDAVICFDVLEHVFLGDITTTLRDIYSYAKSAVLLNVACYPAMALLPTGENAHITVRPPLWWAGMVRGVSFDFPDVDTLLLCSTDFLQAQAFELESGSKVESYPGYIR